jgi:hypothetical protein
VQFNNINGFRSAAVSNATGSVIVYWGTGNGVVKVTSLLSTDPPLTFTLLLRLVHCSLVGFLHSMKCLFFSQLLETRKEALSIQEML